MSSLYDVQDDTVYVVAWHYSDRSAYGIFEVFAKEVDAENLAGRLRDVCVDREISVIPSRCKTR